MKLGCARVHVAWLLSGLLFSGTAALMADDLADAMAAFPRLSAEQDWPWWRGPLRNGIAVGSQSVPTQWNGPNVVKWKTPVPGRGHSSPVVVGDRVVLTTADERQQIQGVLAFDRGTGRQLWSQEISRGGFPARNHPKNTAATPTVACDGERLLVSFFHHETIQLTALDLQGKPQWQTKVGPFNPQRYQYGYAPSPVLYRNSVIVSAEYDGQSALTALDRKTGRQLWRTPRPTNISFSTPVVARVAGRDQLLLSGSDQVASYDPANGKPLWSTQGTTAATCGTMVWEGEIVVASGGYPDSETLAVLADGSGKVLWRNQQKCYEQSMLLHQGYVYALTDNGILYCWRVRDGQEMWKQRLRGPVSSSPVLVGDTILWANERGTWYLFRANPQQFELVAENQLDDESFASPAAVGGQLFIRTAAGSGGDRQEFLYCLTK